MAISMSGATVETSERDSLLGSSVDGGFTGGGAEANTSGGFFGLGAEASGAALAGITSEFASNVSKEIQSYSENVRKLLRQLQDDTNSEVAFKGEGVKAALTKFVDSVREVAESYLGKLQGAETQIVYSVATAYQTQDTDVSQDLTGDSNSLFSQAVTAETTDTQIDRTSAGQ